MSFRDQLAQICAATPGATACALMGFDGIPVDAIELVPGALDVTTLLAEYAAIAAPLRAGGQQQAHAGRMEELVVATDRLTAVLRPLTEDYYLAVVLTPAGLAGKARFLMRQAVAGLRAELA